jgi:hypothetical protein
MIACAMIGRVNLADYMSLVSIANFISVSSGFWLSDRLLTAKALRLSLLL